MALRRAIEEWSREHAWQWRVLLLPWFIYMAWKHAQSAEYVSPFEWLNVVIHEVGHPLFGPLGEFMHVAGGTLLQLLVPILCMVILLSQHEFFGAPLCGVWIADNLFGVARYIADARAQALDYVTLGPNTGEPVEGTHDWEYILSRFNALEQDAALGALVRKAAFALMWGSIFLGLWLTWVMAMAGDKSKALSK